MKYQNDFSSSTNTNQAGRIKIKYPIWLKIFLGGLLPILVLIVAAFLYHQNLSSLGQSAAQILSQNYRSTTLHDLRHAFTTNLRRAGVPEREIMAITGHSSRSTFDRYSKVNEADLRRAVDRPKVFSESSSLFNSKPEKKNPAEAGSFSVTA